MIVSFYRAASQRAASANPRWRTYALQSSGVEYNSNRSPPRWLLLLIVVFAVLAFVLAAGNRFTDGPLFISLPEISLLPPMSSADWERAFVLHQQNPLFVLCGSYQVSGMESLTVYKLLYAWVWLRSFTIAGLSVCSVGFSGILLSHVLHERQGPRPELLVVPMLLASYVAMRTLANSAGTFAGINVGQYSHAVDVTFASVGVALLVRSVLPTNRSDHSLVPFIWGAGITLDIAIGAMFEATDASVVWRTFPGYAGALLPSSDRLFALHPMWRNFTENSYLIQATHRLLSMTLWIGVAGDCLTRWIRGAPTAKSAILWGLLTAEAALGIATLELNVPVVLSMTHQLCAVLVLSVALPPSHFASHRRPF